jgi:hypothetical protein
MRVFSTPEYKEVVFGTSPVCMCRWMDLSLASAWTAGHILFIFGN